MRYIPAWSKSAPLDAAEETGDKHIYHNTTPGSLPDDHPDAGRHVMYSTGVTLVVNLTKGIVHLGMTRRSIRGKPADTEVRSDKMKKKDKPCTV